jgi:HD-GYP domain-containing protein (c-di-GMP phosphodiesterase class II)
MSNTFFPVRLNTLRGNEAVSFDVYILIDHNHIHYTNKWDELEENRLKQLKSKGVRKLFIKSEDEDVYLNYLEKGLDNLSDTTKDINTRGAMAHDAMIMAVENAEKNLETKEGFDAQKRQFDKISDFIVSDRHAIKSILASAGIAVDTNHHAANVSSLALAVASKAGITDRVEIFELGTAALLHDIGKSRLKFDSMKPRDKFTPDELKRFKQHSQDGVDMLAGKPYISPRILGLILSHEELGEGRGFPDKKNLFTLPLSYQILSLVNQFDHFASEKKMPLPTAVDPFFEQFGKHFDENLFTILASALT